MKLDLVNLEPEYFSEDAILNLEKYFNYIELSKSENIEEILKNAIGLITRLNFYIDANILKNAESLKFIATPTTGNNHIDLDYIDKNNIELINLKNEKAFLSNIHSTAEHAFGLIIALSKNYKRAFHDASNFQWNRNNFIGSEISGKTIGIIGLGRLGSKVSNYAKAFGASVIYYDHAIKNNKFEYCELDSLLKKSDIISIHLPYDENTKNFISHKEFALMKKGAYLINTSRGEIIDENALLKALERKKIKGAALDVMKDEHKWDGTIPKSNLLADYAYKNTNLILTPHIGGASYDAMRKTEIFISEKIIQLYQRNKW